MSTVDDTALDKTRDIVRERYAAAASRAGDEGGCCGGDSGCASADNAEFIKGYIEEIPVPDASVDVVISNCVINLSADKRRVLREVARVLKPGGRLAVSDVIADPDMDSATHADMQQWTGCIATHRVHERAASAIVRARMVR